MNLNMQAFNINTLLGGLDKVRDVMGVYQQQLLLIVIVFALLNCFFGYALRKLWSVIPGFFLGAAAGYAAGTYTNQTTTITSPVFDTIQLNPSPLKDSTLRRS